MVKVLESFEGGYLNPSDYDGDTGNFSASPSNPYDGTYSLEPEATGSMSFLKASHVSLTRGETPFGAYVQPGTTDDGGFESAWNLGILFGVPDGSLSGGTVNGYAVGLRKETDFFVLYEVGNGLNYLAGDDSVNLSTSKYYQIEVTQWDSNGNISVSLKETDGTVVSTLSTTNTTYNGGNIGWYSDTPYSQVYDQPYLDYYTKPTTFNQIGTIRIDKAGTILNAPVYSTDTVDETWLRVELSDGTIGALRPVSKSGEPLRAEKGGTVYGIETKQP